jgi:penicillin-binding protein 1A
VAASTVDILKTPITRGTGRRAALAGGRPAAGKTGTQDSNTNAWFVGGTPQYTTAVWMGNWRSNTDKMINIPQFRAFPKVQGGTYPALIWKAYMDAAHAGLPVQDWPKPSKLPRPGARLYLPGTECTAHLAPDGTPIPDAGQTAKRGQLVAPPLAPTLPNGEINYTAPFPSLPAGAVVYDCRTGPPKPTTTTAAPADSAPPEQPPDTGAPAPPAPTTKATAPPTTKKPKAPPTTKKP